MFSHGLPVTRPERTVFDLVVDDEDLSLIADVLKDAWHANRDFDFKRLAGLLRSHYGEARAESLYRGLLEDSGLRDKEGTP